MSESAHSLPFAYVSPRGVVLALSKLIVELPRIYNASRLSLEVAMWGTFFLPAIGPGTRLAYSTYSPAYAGNFVCTRTGEYISPGGTHVTRDMCSEEHNHDNYIAQVRACVYLLSSRI